jgi:hypothetical protein
MKNWLVRIFGLRGSWSWACKQMEAGKIIRPRSATGSLKYKLDNENQRRILWTHKDKPELHDSGWECAYIFLSDFEATDWMVVDRWGGEAK